MDVVAHQPTNQHTTMFPNVLEVASLSDLASQIFVVHDTGNIVTRLPLAHNKRRARAVGANAMESTFDRSHLVFGSRRLLWKGGDKICHESRCPRFDRQNRF